MTAPGRDDASQRDEQQVDALDWGTLALSLSFAAPGSAERLALARAVRGAFSDALERPGGIGARQRTMAAVAAEARRGYDEADERVIDLGD